MLLILFGQSETSGEGSRWEERTRVPIMTFCVTTL